MYVGVITEGSQNYKLSTFIFLLNQTLFTKNNLNLHEGTTMKQVVRKLESTTFMLEGDEEFVRMSTYLSWISNPNCGEQKSFGLVLKMLINLIFILLLKELIKAAAPCYRNTRLPFCFCLKFSIKDW